MKRVSSIDITRGFVMVIMALDHTRDLLHVDSVVQSPTNLSTTTPILFFTRWITYLCAPTFVFLAGTSVYLSIKKQNNLPKSKQFLLKRGLWLILLEFSVINFGLYFDIGFHIALFEVIAAIGCGFIILSLIIKLRPQILLCLGVAIIIGHNFFVNIPFAEQSTVFKVLSPLFNLTLLPLNSDHLILIVYPPVPWLGIMLAGFGTGQLFELPNDKRKALFFGISLFSISLFITIRLVNLYGNPVRWSSQKSLVYTFLSFMNVSKYPPSLLFTLITLGIMFLMLGATEGQKNKLTDIALVYGKVPLFYFIVHFYFIHTILICILLVQGFHWADMSFVSGTFGRPKDHESGIPLWSVYLVWIGVVALLYKPCIWFGNYKANHNYWWLRYI